MSPQTSHTAARHAWEWPDCPDCESPVFVSASRRGGRGDVGGEFKCFLCDVTFGVSKYERRKYP